MFNCLNIGGSAYLCANPKGKPKKPGNGGDGKRKKTRKEYIKANSNL